MERSSIKNINEIFRSKAIKLGNSMACNMMWWFFGFLAWRKWREVKGIFYTCELQGRSGAEIRQAPLRVNIPLHWFPGLHFLMFSLFAAPRKRPKHDIHERRKEDRRRKEFFRILWEWEISSFLKLNHPPSNCLPDIRDTPVSWIAGRRRLLNEQELCGVQEILILRRFPSQ